MEFDAAFTKYNQLQNIAIASFLLSEVWIDRLENKIRPIYRDSV